MREGDILDQRYRIEKKLGQGGMGQVFRGHDLKLDKAVAIKVLFPNTPDLVIKRFHTEAKALGALSHPNIMTAFDFGQADNGQLFLVMDYLKGDSLASLIEKRGVQTFFDMLPIFEKICRGLRFAHMNNVLHRDIKPSNVMLAEVRTKEDSVKLVDFGLAKMAEQDHHLTTIGSSMGSPAYMSPEAVYGKESDVRSDIYSLGCTFFEMMVAQPPFVGDTPFHTMMAQINRLAPTLSQVSGKEYEEEVEEFIRKCIKKNPDDRFQNMDQLIAELNRVKDALTEKKMSSLGLLASGVYSSGSFLLGKVKKFEWLFQGGSRVLLATGAVTIVILLAVAFIRLGPAPEIKQELDTKELSVMATEVAKPEVNDRLEIAAAGETDYPKGATEIEVQGIPFPICLLSGELTDEEVEKEIQPHAGKKAFQLERLKLSDKAAASLLAHPIEMLILRHTELTNGLQDSILNMKTLRHLRIINDKLEPGFLERMPPLQLQSLDLDVGNEYKNLGQPLSKLVTVRGLKIALGSFTREDIRLIATIPYLGALQFNTCNFTADCFADLKSAKRCGVFGIEASKVTVEQVQRIAELPSLISLDLHKTNVNDEGLEKLHGCKHLIEMNLLKTKVTPDGVEALKKSVPTLRKVTYGNPVSDEERLIETLPDL
ncbi:MAG: serine/threonine-protein kinase [Candidatus Melainabacteria bacterium]|nr:serine/threonine-protein kinase [Candidatus Melainabacteria bacterium]